MCVCNDSLICVTSCVCANGAMIILRLLCNVNNACTGCRRPEGCFVVTGHFPQQSPTIIGSFAENNLQLGARQAEELPGAAARHSDRTRAPEDGASSKSHFPIFSSKSEVADVRSQIRRHHQTSTAQEWTNRTPISHEPLICSKICFTKTESVQ